MRVSKNFKLGVFFLVGILLISFVCAEYSRANVQLFQFGSKNTSGVFDQSMCQTGQDFLIQIVPFGCEPAVVRSDLLEEENVPVYCQLGATQVNPLIDVKAIEGISFPGEYPETISGIAFHPAKAALGVEGDLNSPVLNNIGYVVVVLKEQSNASSMPDFVSGNLTAKINYNIKNAFGIGEASFYLPELTDDVWENKYDQYGFWTDRGYLRVDSVDDEGAVISVYDSSLKKVSSVALREKEESGNIFITGFDCLAGLKLKLDEVKNPDTRANFRIEGDIVEVSKGEKFLENRCELTGLENSGAGEKVSVKCKEDNGKSNPFVLEIKPKLQIKIGEKTADYEVGDILYEFNDGSDKRIFLGYYGETAKGTQFIIPVVSKEHTKESFLNSAVYKYLPGFVKTILYKTGIGVADIAKTVGAGFYGSSLIVTSALATGSYPLKMYAKGSKDFTLFDFTTVFAGAIDNKLKLPSIEFVGFASSQDKGLPLDSADSYKKAMEDYDRIIDNFASERYSEKATYGQKAFAKKIALAWKMEQKETVAGLCNDFEERYSAITSDVRDYCDSGYKLSSSSDATETIVINGMPKTISFEGIYEPSLNEFSADVFIQGIDEAHTWSGPLQKGEKFYVSEKEFISLEDLEKDYAVFDVRSVEEPVGKKLIYSPESLKINLKDYEVIGANNYQIRVDEIHLTKTAKVSLIPNINAAGTEANFSFKIGIEKRSIELSPEKTRKLIAELNTTIGKWNNISETLGETVEGLKTACLATGVVLTAKNLFANAGGKAIARQNVMRGSGGWYEKCTDLVSAQEFETIEQCLYENQNEIDSDVNLLYDVIEEQNENIGRLQEGLIEKKFLSEDVVDNKKFMEKYAPQVQKYLEDNFVTIDDPDGKAGSIKVSEMIPILSYSNWENGGYSIEQMRDIELYAKALKAEPQNKIAQKGLYESCAEIKSVSENYLRIKDAEQRSGEKGFSGISFKPYTDNVKKIEVYEGFTAPQNLGDIKQGELLQGISYHNAEYYVGLEELGNNNYRIKDIYTLDGVRVDEDDSIKNTYAYFKKYDTSSYENNFKSSSGENTYVVRYYETEPYKGLPAVVPFDVTDGWYAATKQTLPIAGNIRAYDESGRVTSFWLCNVGANGIEEFKATGDDLCELVNLGTGQPYNQFAGLSESEAKNRVEAGVKAIEQASKAYRSGVNNVNINVGYGSINLKVGSPAVDIPDMQCQDFMSPKDCQLLFNVCDPVICPSSRCDLGGAYPVQDVIQSGIIGSLALCLPNAAEGIYIPVCLSGLNAGIEGLLSVFTSYRDCLQESLDTGKMVGVCDEIYSVYMCEFLWKQALPLADIAIPKVLEFVTGQSAHGGGEYLGAQSAWDNAQNSVNYFTQYYGKNSYDAFKARNAEEAGSEICKVYVSGVYADAGNLLDSLTEPDSPPQFHGRFDEIPFTTVTVPATSQYKVYYHIYAGKDSGAYYKVYLKGTPGSSFYQDVATSRMVASGYVVAGASIDETPDFIAPSGYKELCISVNNQEECGFKQVSTAFAVNYVTDKYLEEQASMTDIKSESECISGSASVYGLLTPNVQEGAEGVINPEIYNRGIIRICATENPGKGTDAYAGGENSRWVNVGYCDNQNIKCWLDTQSVEEIIKNSDIEDQTLEEASHNQLDILRNQGGYISSDDFVGLVGVIEELINDLKFEEAITKVDENLEKVFFNDEKANLYYLRGEAYGYLARNIRISDEDEERQTSSTASTSGTSPSPETKTSTVSQTSAKFSSNYVSPSFSLKLNSMAKEVNYRYFNSKWHWSFSLDNWVDINLVFDADVNELPNDHKEIAESLRGKAYAEGMKILFEKLQKGLAGGFQNPEILAGGNNWYSMFSDEGFEIKKENEKVWFKYESGKWMMSFDRGVLLNVWYAVSEVNYDKETSQATWQWDGRERGKKIIFDETVNLISSLKTANFENGVVMIFDSYYPVASNIEGETIEEEKREEIKQGINLKIFDEKQVRILEYAGSCKDCNKWKGRECTKELCESIGIQSGNNCLFQYGTSAGAGDCKAIKWEETNEPSKVYDLNSALTQTNDFLKEYGEAKLNSNDLLKQFVWDLRLNNILTEKEYNSLMGWLVKNLRELKNILTLKTSGAAH